MDLDIVSVYRGAVIAVFLGAPAGIAAQVIADDNPDNIAVGLFRVLGIVAFVAGGWWGARSQRETPLIHGGAAAIAGWAVVQIIGTTRRLLVGTDISIGAIFFGALLAATCGIVGGLIASRGHRAAGAGD